MSDLDLLGNRSGDLAPTGHDPFLAEGAKLNTTGQFLTLTRVGKFVSGQNRDEIPLGTRLVANMPGLRKGWRRWEAGHNVEDLTELVSEGRPVPARSTLGYMDQSQWEKDDQGQPRDPWQLSYVLEMSDGETLYIYAASSKGGFGAIGRLCTMYGKERRMRPGMVPIIELQAECYMHPIYKETFVPNFPIVGWTDEANPSVDGGDDDVPTGRAALPAPGQRAANPTSAAHGTGGAASARPAAQGTANSSTTTTSPSSGASRTPRF